MAERFEIFKDRAGNYKFYLIAGNGQVLLTSESYTTQASCLNGVQSVITNAPNDSRYERKQSVAGSYYFNLKATNGQIIGTSEQYISPEARDHAIDFIKASNAQITYKDSTSNASKKQSKIGSITTYLTAIEGIYNDKDSVLFFRGHSDYNYSMIPSIYRDTGWINNEDVLFKELILKCPSDFYSNESTFQSLVKMQHYSLPTRLLDITTNPLIALYFATSESSNDGEVVILKIPKREIKYFDSDTVSVLSNISRRPAEFSIDSNLEIEEFNLQKEIRYLLHEIKKEKPYFEPSINPKDLESVVCVKPKLDNARIIKQDGAFLLFGMNKIKTNPASIPEKYIVKGDNDPLIIKSETKKNIRSQLTALGITEGSIYPEIDRVAGHIKTIYSSKQK